MASFNGFDNLKQELVDKAKKLQEALTTDGLKITSGYRSPERNAQVGGWEKSYHLKGEALDIARYSFKENPHEFTRIARGVGFRGVGIYDTHVHVDTGVVNFWDKRDGNGVFDRNNMVKVDFDKINQDLKKESTVKKSVDTIISTTKDLVGVDKMGTPIAIGLLVLAILGIAKK